MDRVRHISDGMDGTLGRVRPGASSGRSPAEIAFAAAGEGIVVLDREFRIIAANPAYEALIGVPESDLVGRTPTPLDREAELREPAVLAALRAGRTWRGDVPVAGNGDARPAIACSVTATFGDDDSVSGYVAVFSDIAERTRRERVLQDRATHDPLTGLPNREFLLERLEQLSSAARRSDRRIAAMFIDLDEFKQVNDTYGHEHGDQLLVEVGRQLVGAVRDRDVVARLGGDEFVVLLADVEDRAEVEAAADRLLQVLSTPFELEVGSVVLSGSLGIAMGPADAARPEELINLADRAMYEAKTAGRNTYRFSPTTG